MPGLSARLSWDLSGLTTTGVAAVVSGLRGDFDHNDRVDGDDLLAWQRGGAPSRGDLVNWRANFGRGLGGGASPVPEPASVGMLLMAACAGCGTRRRSRR